jgi:hypothetical protein
MLSENQRAFGVVLAMILVVVVPATIALNTVKRAGVLEVPADPTPLGYTWSLLLFAVPLLTLAFWFLRHPQYSFQKKSFWRTLAVLVPLGVVLDVFFGHDFFTFENPQATLGISFPALGGPLPVEELVFYVTGFMVILLSYIWADEYWLAAYNVPDYKAEAGKIRQALRFHATSAWVGLALLAAAIAYRKWFSADPDGFPWYFTYLTLASLIPAVGLFRTVEPLINWRAFAFTFFWILLVSLLWEATLALPYGWWGYKDEAMIGIFIGAWSRLPVEAVLVWLASTFSTVILFETVKIWTASGRGLRDFLIKGKGAAPSRKVKGGKARER